MLLLPEQIHAGNLRSIYTLLVPLSRVGPNTPSISCLLISGYFVDNYLRIRRDSARAAPHVGSSELLDFFKLVPADVGQLKNTMASVLSTFASNLQN